MFQDKLQEKRIRYIIFKVLEKNEEMSPKEAKKKKKERAIEKVG